MKKTRRAVLALSMLLVFAVAVPASAASWRGYGAVRADAGYPTLLSGTAKNVGDIQIGIYTYGAKRKMDWNASFACARGSKVSSRSKSGTVTTQPRTWKWVTIRDGGKQDLCDVSASAYPKSGKGAHRLKVRVK